VQVVSSELSAQQDEQLEFASTVFANCRPPLLQKHDRYQRSAPPSPRARRRPRRFLNLTAGRIWLIGGIVAGGGAVPSGTAMASSLDNQFVPGSAKEVSCLTSKLCVVVGSNKGVGDVVDLSGGKPGKPLVVKGSRGLYAIDCPAPAGCIALGSTSSSTDLLIVEINSQGRVAGSRSVPLPSGMSLTSGVPDRLRHRRASSLASGTGGRSASNTSADHRLPIGPPSTACRATAPHASPSVPLKQVQVERGSSFQRQDGSCPVPGLSLRAPWMVLRALVQRFATLRATTNREGLWSHSKAGYPAPWQSLPQTPYPGSHAVRVLASPSGKNQSTLASSQPTMAPSSALQSARSHLPSLCRAVLVSSASRPLCSVLILRLSEGLSIPGTRCRPSADHCCLAGSASYRTLK